MPEDLSRIRHTAAALDRQIADFDDLHVMADYRIHILDKTLTEVGVIGDDRDIKVNFTKGIGGVLTSTIPGDHPLRDFLCNNPDGEDAVMYAVVKWEGITRRWEGKITDADEVHEGGQDVIEITAEHVKRHLDNILLWAMPGLPMEVQVIDYLGVGYGRTTLKQAILANVVRLQASGYRITPNMFDRTSWPRLARNLHPFYVVPHDPRTDHSKFVAFTANMTPASKTISEVTKGTGLQPAVWLWLPGDPQPSDWDTLTKPTICIDIVDKSGPIGETGDIFTGLFTYLAGRIDAVGEQPFFRTDDKPPSAQYLVPGDFGQDPDDPYVVLRQGRYTALGDWRINHHFAGPRNLMVGGKSPDIVNAIVNAAITALLGWLAQLLGIPGLSALFQGIGDDRLFSWMLFRDAHRTAAGGVYGYAEGRASGMSKAWTPQAFQAGMGKLWDTRGKRSHQAELLVGQPYYPLVHIHEGDPVGFETPSGAIWRDYVEDLTFASSESTPRRWSVTLGEPEPEDPVVLAFRELGKIGTVVNWLNFGG